MFFRRIIGATFLLLILGGLFGLVNNNRQSDAYTQGYIAGQQSVTTNEDGTETAVSPAPAPYPKQHSGFGFFGGIFKFFFFFFGFIFFIGLLSKIFSGKHPHHDEGGWHHARHWGKWYKQDSKAPWYDDNADDDHEEPIMKA